MSDGNTIYPYRPKGMQYDFIQTESPKKKKAGKYTGSSLGIVRRPEGERFYLGHGTGKSQPEAADMAEMNFLAKAVFSPADSVRSKNVRKSMSPKNYRRVFELLRNSPLYLSSEKL